ncbi:MAG: DUF5856 family protein [Candidatus Azobacteroides sp.]|nr:DUF5856 family protein [Candidatus Azobacteroides sp.]
MAKTSSSNAEIAVFLGELYAFNVSLKLFHWHVTGPGSYAKHMALDQAIDSLSEALDSIVETSYALLGDLPIVVPETRVPGDIVQHVSDFYQEINEKRNLFKEDFTESLCDDFQEAIQQLLYRLKRLQ